jgi:hypothetical protein
MLDAHRDEPHDPNHYRRRMSEAAFVLIGTVVGALAGLLPKFIDMISSSESEEQEQAARLRMMLAGVLMSCVQSTNEFLDQAALLLLARNTEGEDVAAEELRKAVSLAFAMKTAWMYALVSFGDSIDGKQPADPRRNTIAEMLEKLDTTYAMHQTAEVTPERVVDQLLEIATLSRGALQELIGLRTVP